MLTRCLQSVLDASGFDQLILAYDGEDDALGADLRSLAVTAGAEFYSHDRTLGYTAGSNQILRRATGDIVVLLNSDTVVPHGWIGRLLLPFADPDTGLAGPWSNAATVQSVPELPSIAGYDANRLPAGTDVEDVNATIARHLEPASPEVPALNGFCLAIRRGVVESIGLFDAEAFPEGYGEELDYALRARAAGFTLRVADALYVHHAKSHSFGKERREILSKAGKQKLRQLYGDDATGELLAGLRAWGETSPQRADRCGPAPRPSGGPAAIAAVACAADRDLCRHDRRARGISSAECS